MASAPFHVGVKVACDVTPSTTHTPPSTSGIPEPVPSLDHHHHPQAHPPDTAMMGFFMVYI